MAGGSSVANVYDVATALDLVAATLGGGLPLTDALDRVAEVTVPAVGRDLRRVAAALRWGVDDRVAWQQVADVWRPAGVALGLARDLGVPPRLLLHDAATAVRRREDTRLAAAGARLGVLLVLPLGLAFLPAFVLLAVVPVVIDLTRASLSGMT
ncbi:hypothetical protein GCM10027579_25970 [Calidifontibacter terrae]